MWPHRLLHLISNKCCCDAQAAPLIKSIPKESYSALPFVLAPLLSNPVAMAANRAAGASSPVDALQRVGQGMLDMVPGLGKLTEILPQETLVWKLRLLAQGCRFMDTRYHLVLRCLSLPAHSALPGRLHDSTRHLHGLLGLSRLLTAAFSCQVAALQGKFSLFLHRAGPDFSESSE